MALKAVIETEAEIPEGLKEHYTERGGKWELQADGLKTQADIDRVMESLRKEREEHKATENELTQAKEKANTLSDELQVLKKTGGKGDDDREPTNEERMELAKLRREAETFKKQLAEATEKYESLNTKVTMGEIKDVLRSEFGKVIRSDALEFEVEAAASNFVKSETGILTNPDLGDNGGKTPEAYAAEMLASRKFLAIPSNSGGATGGTGKVPPTGDGPLDPVEFLNSQMGT